jgi:hypothetical protein
MVNPPAEVAKQKVNERVAVSRAEVILLLLLLIAGMGLWVWVDREVSALIKYREPREEQLQGKFHVPARQADVLRAQDELKAVQSQLIEARLEQTKQSATVKALAAAHPELAQDAPPTSLTETLQSYNQARLKELTANQLVESLAQRFEALKAEGESGAAQLEEAKHSASKEFHQSQASYLLLKSGLTFILTLLLMSLPLIVIWHFVSPSVEGRKFTVQHPSLFWLVGCALFILFAYQAFETAGAALVGVVVLLILLTYIWPAKADVAVEKK